MLVKPRKLEHASLTTAFYYLGRHALQQMKEFLKSNGLSFEESFYEIDTILYTADTHEPLNERTYVVIDPDQNGFNLVPYEKFWVNYRPIEHNLI